MDVKTNKITHLPTLLTQLTDRGLLPDDAVITADALHTQTNTAETIVAAGADYIFTVKQNQPSLYDHIAALPWQGPGEKVFQQVRTSMRALSGVRA